MFYGLVLDKALTHMDENLILGAVYIPPENSNFFNEEEFMTLENEITSICSDNKYVILTGDFNARTAELKDYTQPDDFLSQLFDFDEETSEFFYSVSKLGLYDIPADRQSMDKHTNNIGNKLLDVCKNNNLFLCNGRIGNDKQQGNFTFKQLSVIDYTIASIETLPLLQNFEIQETDALMSDGHSFLSCSVVLPSNRDTVLPQQNEKNTSPKWDEKYANTFFGSINRDEVYSIINFLGSSVSSKRDINVVTERISDIFKTASAQSIPQPQKHHVQKTKPWFGAHCKTARRKYHLARRRYHCFKNQSNREYLSLCSKEYKKTMNKYIAQHKTSTQKKLRSLESKSPKQYWKFINSLKQKTSKTVPTLEEFYNHFKLLNTSHEDSDEVINPDNMQTNEYLNSKITQEEILRAIRSLNNGKAPGCDHILNEYIKSTSYIFLPLYETFFNVILDTGYFPEQWSIGCIHLIYKNKGDRTNPKNYRPITILSCLGKLFTSILNIRLNQYLEENLILLENQAGFRKQYSTLDHIFTLHALNEIMKSRKQKLFCCFVDFSSAFDSIWRAGLWQKLLQNGVDGKVFKVIYNMYNDIKSCVSLFGSNSSLFTSSSGVRQGENLSPVLFSIYLNDLEYYLMENPNAGVQINSDNDYVSVLIRLVVLLYADDTVILASNENDLQYTLDKFFDYCQTWKLRVNINKTKVLIFGARRTNSYSFHLGDNVIEITDKYKYLGIYFSQSRSFLNARKHIVEQAKKAMHLLYCRTNNLNLPVDLQLKLFDHTVLPILTYACEIFSFENLDMLEKVHTDFLRKISKSKRSTPLYMLYAELGRYPLEIIIKTRTIGFWTRILLGKQSKLSYSMYQVLNTGDITRFKWTSNVKQILCNTGRNDVWVNQNNSIPNNIKFYIKQNLQDQFIQRWRSDLTMSSKGKNFHVFKDSIQLESYFTTLPRNLYINMVRFRTGNHKMPIEVGRWNNIDIDDRKCNLCTTNSIGDEFHYLLECPYFKHDRRRLIPAFYFERPNMLKFRNLLCTRDVTCLVNLSKFMGLIIKFLS